MRLRAIGRGLVSVVRLIVRRAIGARLRTAKVWCCSWIRDGMECVATERQEVVRLVILRGEACRAEQKTHHRAMTTRS